MRFGLSKVNITPEPGTRLLGHPKSLKSEGKYTDLFSRALYLSSDKNGNVLIISVDLCLLPTEIVTDIRKKISKDTEIGTEHIIVHTTHTHAGPVVGGVFDQKDPDPREQEKISNAIIKSGVQAFSNRAGGTIRIGRMDLKGISFNRRYIMKDGSVETHPHKDDPNILAAEGPVDTGLAIMALYDEQGKLQGIAANYACHLTSSERNNIKFSADFPYYAEEILQSHFNNNSLVMLYLNGACGNICQVNVEDRKNVEVGDAHSQKVGKIFAESIIDLISRSDRIDPDAEIRTIYRELKIPIRRISKEMLEKAKNTTDRYTGRDFDVPRLSNYGTESLDDEETLSLSAFMKTDFWKKIAANELINLYEKYKHNGLENVPVTVARINGILIATVPGELFVEYGLKIKNFLDPEYGVIFIIELANGSVGYIPTKKAFDSKDGGYEVQLLSTSKLDESAGEVITSEILDMEKELRG